MAIRLYDDPGQPHIGETGIGGLIRTRWRLARWAEQWAAEDRRQQLIGARALHSRRGRYRMWLAGYRRGGGNRGIRRGQFDGDHASEQSAAGQQTNQNPIDHRRALTGVSLPRTP